jgi:AraC-like DNA-binding protein
VGTSVQWGISGYAEYSKGEFLADRLRSDWLLVWLHTGDARWRSGGTDHSLSPGMLILSAPGQPESYHWSQRTTTRHGFVHFLPADDLAPLFQGLGSTCLDRERATIPIILLEQILSSLAARQGGWETLCHSALRHIALTIAAATSATAPIPPPILMVLTRLRNQWITGIWSSPPLPHLAEWAGITPGALCRLFKNTYGAGPLQVLQQVRLQRAASLLRQSGDTVKEVGRACGFADQCHFSRAFRAQHGASPLGFRNIDRDRMEPPPESGPIAQLLRAMQLNLPIGTPPLLPTRVADRP